MSRGRRSFVTVIATALFAIAHFRQIYMVRVGAEGQMAWNANEADVLLHEVIYGYQMSYLGFALNAVEGILFRGWGEGYGNRRVYHHNVMLKITAAKFQRFDVADTTLNWVTPVDGNLFSASDSGVQRWTGNRFVSASPRETEEFENTLHSSSHGPDYDNVNGWSARSSILGGSEHQYTIHLSGRTLTLEVTGHVNTAHELSIDVLRPGEARETIWYLSERPRRVSETEYKEVFGNH